MNSKKLNTEEVKSIVVSSLLLVLGVIFCCSLAIGIKALSFIVGICLIVGGIINISFTIYNKKSVCDIQNIAGTLILAFGILIMELHLVGILFYYIPWLMIIIGVVLILYIITSLVNEGESFRSFLAELIIGVFLFALGLCLKFIEGFIEYAGIMFGIVLILLSIYMIVGIFVKRKE